MGRGSFERNFLSEILIEKNSKLDLVNLQFMNSNSRCETRDANT